MNQNFDLVTTLILNTSVLSECVLIESALQPKPCSHCLSKLNLRPAMLLFSIEHVISKQQNQVRKYFFLFSITNIEKEEKEKFPLAYKRTGERNWF